MIGAERSCACTPHILYTILIYQNYNNTPKYFVIHSLSWWHKRYQIGLCEGVEPRGRKHIINADWIIFSNVYSEILYLRLFVYKEISVLSRSFSWYIWRIFWCIGSHRSHMPRSQDQDRPTSRPDRTCADRIRDILVLNPQHHCNKKRADINVKLQSKKSANKDGIFFRFF